MTYTPRSIEEYGAHKTHVVIAQNYLASFDAGAPMAKAVLLHGPPGTGKTTIIKLLAKERRLPIVDLNASLEMDFDKIRTALTSGTISAPYKVVFFDEADSMTASQQKKLATLIDGAKHAVFLACNDIKGVDGVLRKLCLTVEVPLPNEAELRRLATSLGLPFTGANSYRGVLTGSEEPVRDESFDARIRAVLRGEDSWLNPSEHYYLGTHVIDNTAGGEALAVDEWLQRYRTAGAGMTKYLMRSVPRVADPQFPWSVMVRKKEPEQKAPRKSKKPKMPESAPTEPVKSSKPANSAIEDLF